MINHKGDDTFYDRLLSYLQSQFNGQIIEFYPIRSLVFYVQTQNHTYILKGYYSNKRAKLQEAFTATLRKEGFFRTYRFFSPPSKEPLYFEGIYFGITGFIPLHEDTFSFQTKQNREDGLELLNQFHRITARFESRYRTLLPKANLLEKWRERLNLFFNNFPIIGYFINHSILLEIVSWAEWSLAGMEAHRDYYLNEPYVILHGDVAHHNFLRDTYGKLHLIDFDLISIGPAANDYVQYANRILPFLGWSLDKLEEMKHFQPFLKDEAFLFALAYPADILREWNRIVREKTYTDHEKVKQIMDLSIGQFFDRKKFIDSLKKKTEG